MSYRCKLQSTLSLHVRQDYNAKLLDLCACDNIILLSDDLDNIFRKVMNHEE